MDRDPLLTVTMPAHADDDLVDQSINQAFASETE
jgi:hypothetical protein